MNTIDYISKARQNFYHNRPYGIRIDRQRNGFVLFNREMNVLGSSVPGNLDSLPLEHIPAVGDIPCMGEIVKEAGKVVDVFFYTDESNPYRDGKLDMDRLKSYNRYIYPLSLLLGRTL